MRRCACAPELSGGVSRDKRGVYRIAVMGFCKRRFPTRRTRETFGASVISSVIGLAESENRSKQTGADEKI
jgi:hypothetical protein